MPVISREIDAPVERREIDIAREPIEVLREHEKALTERWNELGREGGLMDHSHNHLTSKAINLSEEMNAIRGAIVDRTEGREVSAIDREFLLGSNQKSADRELVPPTLEPVAEKLTLKQQYEAAVERLERETSGLSRDPDVREELKVAWNDLQSDNPRMERSETLSMAATGLSEGYRQEHVFERDLAKELTLAAGMEV